MQTPWPTFQVTQTEDASCLKNGFAQRVHFGEDLLIGLGTPRQLQHGLLKGVQALHRGEALHVCAQGDCHLLGQRIHLLGCPATSIGSVVDLLQHTRGEALHVCSQGHCYLLGQRIHLLSCPATSNGSVVDLLQHTRESPSCVCQRAQLPPWSEYPSA